MIPFYVRSLTPIIIASLLLLLGIFTDMSEHISTITTALWVVVGILIIITVIILIYNFFRDTSFFEKILSFILISASIIMTYHISNKFLSSLSNISTINLVEMLHFAKIITVVGGAWLISIVLFAFASVFSVTDDGYESQVFLSILCIAGALTLSGYYGIL